LTWVALGFLVLDHGSGKIVLQAATQSEQPVAEGFCSAVDSLMRCPQADCISAVFRCRSSEESSVEIVGRKRNV